ncbi:MAG: ADP-L-glycero-D-manno-heptose-6-epimerase, partial [Candidatus Adlerbacteria bacterium]|nr:ADP-L-glycero-D-manno-heptose-6-epimerase [Candidatus Adlerbacteria bacterium]
YAITYFYNVYGPRERSGKYGTLVQIFNEQKKNGGALTVVSPGTQKRNFTHVDDIVDGLLLVGAQGTGDEFGLGSPESFSVLEVAGMFGGEVTMLPERPGNRMTAALDSSKAESLGWKASRNLAAYIQTFI